MGEMRHLPARGIDERLRGSGRRYELVSCVPPSLGETPRGMAPEAGACGIPDRALVRGVLLTDGGGGERLVVLRAGDLIDFDALHAATGRRWEPAGLEAAGRRFPDCDPGCVPVLGEAYGVPVVIDVAVGSMGMVHFEAGRHGCFVRMAAREFMALQPRALVARVARSVPRVERAGSRAGGDLAGLLPTPDVCARIERLYRLPALPPASGPLRDALAAPEPLPAPRLLELVVEAGGTEFALALAGHPLLRGPDGPPGTLEAAAAGPLGAEGVAAAALGATVARGMEVPMGGPLGEQALTAHAVHCAAVAVTAAARAGATRAPLRVGHLVAAALLHDVGLRLLAHLFLPEFHLLNRMAAANPGTPLPDLELHLLALGDARKAVQCGHARLGGWLLEGWGFPRPAVIAACAHHDPALVARDPGWACAALVGLAEALLARADGCGGLRARLPRGVAVRLGLDGRDLAALEKRLAMVLGRGAERHRGVA